MLEIRKLGLAEVLEIRTPRFSDDRGFFSEVWNAATWAQAGLSAEFVQDNHSLSVKLGVLRGLHYQLPPFAQDKLVRVSKGAIFDVAVDLRRSSPTFGMWVGLRVSAEAGNQIFVPKGFAHGFLTLEPYTEVQYKVTAPYSPDHERAVRYNDPEIGVEWPVMTGGFHLSAKDEVAPMLSEIEVFA